MDCMCIFGRGGSVSLHLTKSTIVNIKKHITVTINKKSRNGTLGTPGTGESEEHRQQQQERACSDNPWGVFLVKQANAPLWERHRTLNAMNKYMKSVMFRYSKLGSHVLSHIRPFGARQIQYTCARVGLDSSQLLKILKLKNPCNSLTRLVLEGFLLSVLKGSGENPPPEVPPATGRGFPQP